MKLSGAYSNSKSGPPYPEATRTARAWVAAAPERLEVWAPDAATRNRILVANPQTLYGFRPRPA